MFLLVLIRYDLSFNRCCCSRSLRRTSTSNVASPCLATPSFVRPSLSSLRTPTCLGLLLTLAPIRTKQKYSKSGAEKRQGPRLFFLNSHTNHSSEPLSNSMLFSSLLVISLFFVNIVKAQGDSNLAFKRVSSTFLPPFRPSRPLRPVRVR
ncbi:hypothetical protein BDY24DRAFT_265665 [Mrakia frigida]|uniref:uncharacterized protein n=1 Tax=Mrakia frigida TaxID=29902 RepID=UPI003FCC216E